MNRKPRILAAALAVSVLINAFFAGLWFMQCCGPRANPYHISGRSGSERMARAVGHLDPENQDAVRQILGEQDATMKSEGDAVMQQLMQIHNILTAPHFDSNALATAHEALEDHDKNLKDTFYNTTTHIAGILPDKERIKFFNSAFPPPPGVKTAPSK